MIIKIKCSDCDWEFVGEELDTEEAFDKHCYEQHDESVEDER